MQGIRTFRTVGLISALALASAANGQAPIQPGQDKFETRPGSALNFGEGLPPIPPDFFGPGSEPFIGKVNLTGNPSPSSPDSRDTIIQRQAPASLPADGAVAMIPIEIVALNLRSSQPIQVSFGGGVDSFFDVFVQLQPAPSTSNAAVVRTDLMSGEIRYNPQVSMNVTFVPLGPGDVVTMPIFGLMMEAQSACEWGQLPFAGVGGSLTPNLFPRTEFALASPGNGFVHVLRPARHIDCDGDGVPDHVQILENPSLDMNGNGVLDRCETNAGITQLSFPLLDPDLGFAERYSASGQLAIRYIPSFFDVFWQHSRVNGEVATRNAPMLEVNDPGDFQTTHIPIRLHDGPPIQIELVQLELTSTGVPLAPLEPIPFPPGVSIPVFEHELYAGIEDGPIDAPILHGFAEGLITQTVPAGTWMTVSRRAMEGVNEARNHCAPGAVARSLDWLENILCLNLPANNNEAQEMYEKLRNMQHLMTTTTGGTLRTKYVPGINQFLSDKMLQDCLSVMRVIDNDPCTMFEDLQKGCDIVGNISWYKADGTRNGGHAVTVSAAIKCNDEVSIEFNDDAYGKDRQGDGKADSGETKKAKIMADPDNPGRNRMVGYGRNSWDGYIKICPTRKCQIDAINKWINGDATAGVEGLESLVNRLLDGEMPTEQDKKNIRRWAQNSHDLACFLMKNLEGCDDPALDDAKMAAASIKQAMGIVVVRCIIYSIDCNLAELGILPGLLGGAFDALRDQVRAGVDCNGNGVDDLADIANGTSVDANGNCIPDECEPQPCPGDYNGDGVVDLADLLEFLGQWNPALGQNVPPGTGADVNGDGVIDLADLLDFLGAWNPNLGQTCP